MHAGPVTVDTAWDRFDLSRPGSLFFPDAGALGFAQVMHFDGVPGLELPDIDITGIATAYGIPATQFTSLAQLTTAVRAALAGDGPRLIEVPQQRLSST